MNTPKKITFALTALAVAGFALFSLGTTPALRAETAPTDSTAIQAQLWQMREIMHNARFVAIPLAEGVQVAVTAEDAEMTAAIRAQFGTDNELPSPVPGSTASAAETYGGVTLTFRTDDAALVPTLQAQGTGLAYGLLRQNMHAVMTALQANGGGYGPGRMGSGMGGGMGSGMGGRGMMGPGYGAQGSGHMGGGYGQMGGWMHGPATQAPDAR